MLGRTHFCQHCGSRAVCRTQPGRVGRLVRFLFFHPILCVSCGNRFWRLTTAPPPDLEPVSVLS